MSSGDLRRAQPIPRRAEVSPRPVSELGAPGTLGAAGGCVIWGGQGQLMPIGVGRRAYRAGPWGDRA